MESSTNAGIVIIGGGGAGLTAAVAAADAGVDNITVLEKAGIPGGNTGISHGIFAVNSQVQQRLGLEMSADEIFRDKMDYANWRVDPRVVRATISKSADVIRWLEEKGLSFNHVAAFVPEPIGYRVFHQLAPGPEGAVGQEIIDMLVKDCRQKGVRLLYNTAAEEILTDGSGKMAGVVAKAKDGETRIAAGAIIVATGGFGGNREMMNRYFPGHGDIFGNTLPQMTGDGIIMAEAAGAHIDNLPALLAMGPHHYPWARSLCILVRRPETILVNKNGERYTDESLNVSRMDSSGACLSRQPDMICYALIDSETKKVMTQKRESFGALDRDLGGNGAWLDELDEDFKTEAAGGTASVAKSLEEMAGYIGARPEVLRATVERYNSFCDNGYDADFLKEKRFLYPLRRPPYYAVLGRQGFDTTLGGIRINHRAEVLDRQGCAIGGLYAAGDTATGCQSVNYNHRYPGSALTFAIVYGYIAGENAAAYVKGQE